MGSEDDMVDKRETKHSPHQMYVDVFLLFHLHIKNDHHYKCNINLVSLFFSNTYLLYHLLYLNIYNFSHIYLNVCEDSQLSS